MASSPPAAGALPTPAPTPTAAEAASAAAENHAAVKAMLDDQASAERVENIFSYLPTTQAASAAGAAVRVSPTAPRGHSNGSPARTSSTASPPAGTACTTC